MQPLAGLTVVALEQAVAAPLASRHLADLGARVIKIERPGTGDFARGYDRAVRGLSSHFVWLNRGKESVTLNVKHPAGRAILAQLVARADVFVHNLAPGAVERLGFGAAELLARHPRLIVCAVSGYGRGGPYAAKKAYDLLIQAESGLMAVTGTPDEPVKVGISVADIATGMYAALGSLGALYQRTVTGRGTVVEIAMLDALGEWMGYPAYYTAYGGTAPPRTGAHHATIAPYGPYPVGDGAWVFVAVQNDREWRAFCAEVLEAPALAEDPRFRTNPDRVRHRAELDAVIRAAWATATVAAVTARLEAARIAYARQNTVEEFWQHPQLAARDRWRMVPSPVGPLRMLRPPWVSADEAEPVGAVPALGEHTAAVLQELGYDAAARAALKADGVI
jgi:itaconate CoA-transferase